MGRLNITRKLFAPAATWLITSLVLAAPVLDEVPLENPDTADAMGVNVYRIRYAYILIGGMLAGLGGAYLSLFYAPCWIENMTAGRGWIALALVIFAVWSPLRALAGAWLFGGIEALGFRIQILGATVSPFFLKMLPYLFTIVVLILFTVYSRRKRIGAPAALGMPYERE